MHPTLNRSSQSLFYSVPQEKRRRPCWGWKNMGESILHWEVGPGVELRPFFTKILAWTTFGHFVQSWSQKF